MPTAKLTNRYVEIFQALFPEYDIISTSITEQYNIFLALARKGLEKLLVIGAGDSWLLPADFQGVKQDSPEGSFLICTLNHENAEAMRSLLPYTKPVTIGNTNSFGFGDRLGNAGAAHLRALMESKPFFLPVLAQQSIRELDRSGRTADEVMDAATWAVFQMGYKGGFCADADHLKTTDDVDYMMKAGFTMVTIDPSDYTNNLSQSMSEAELNDAYHSIPWDKLNDDPENFMHRYAGKTIKLKGDISFTPLRTEILRAAVKYGNVIIHTTEMFRYLRDNYPDHDTEVELSIDETPYPTTPVEHLIVASELQRLEVELVSLAPRFCGDFEKGIDYKGDLDAFCEEYLLHQAIAAKYGGYKLSFHSGSDKFSIYEAIGELDTGNIHVKTAGTSYLEALRAVALCDTQLFREIMAFSMQRFDADRKTYHISADTARMRDPGDYSSEDLPKLLDDDNARQVFHVTFGSVLTHQEADGKPGFRDRMMTVMTEYEELYEECLYKHFRKHISPFEKNKKDGS